MTLAELNACDRERFVDVLGWVFEHSPWVAERVWSRRPFSDLHQLHARMVAEISAADRDEQIALLQAHPDLGTRIRMSDASAGEQAGAGLDRLTAAEFEQLQRQTSAYRGKFGFPFLLSVKGCTKQDVLAALERRLPRQVEAEWHEALRQVARIAERRLHDIVNGEYR